MAYNQFAQVYDYLMQDAPYEWWVNWIKGIVDHENWKQPRVAEIGCGTGSILVPIAKEGWQVYGIDLSEEMLSIASAKAADAGVFPVLLHQDMRSFDVDSQPNLVYSLCDSLNYLLEAEDVRMTFSTVYRNLQQGGIFAFDYHTEHMLANVLGNQTFTERDDDISYIWDSTYDDEETTVTYDISFFMREEGDCYRRFEEVHQQRAFPQSQLVLWLEESGFTIEHIYGDFSDDPPHSMTERLFFIARKK